MSLLTPEALSEARTDELGIDVDLTVMHLHPECRTPGLVPMASMCELSPLSDGSDSTARAANNICSRRSGSDQCSCMRQPGPSIPYNDTASNPARLTSSVSSQPSKESRTRDAT